MMAILTNKQFLMLGGAVLVGGVFLASKAQKTVAGIVTGDNAITKGTVYEGHGILGTMGSVANEASGGFFEEVGGKIGETLFDWFGPKTNDIEAQRDRDYEVISYHEEISE